MNTTPAQSPMADALMALTHVQEASDAADQLSRGCQLQQLGPALLGRTLWVWWPDHNRWYEAHVTHYDAGTGEFQ